MKISSLHYNRHMNKICVPCIFIGCNSTGLHHIVKYTTPGSMDNKCLTNWIYWQFSTVVQLCPYLFFKLTCSVLFFFLSTMVPRMSINWILTSQNSLHYMVCKCKPGLWGQTVTHLSHRRLSDSQLQPEGPVETSAQPGVRPVVGFCRPRKTPTIKINDCWRPKPPRPESLAEPIMGTKMRTKNTCIPHVHLASYSYSQRLEPGMHRQAPWICGNLGYHVRPIDNLPHLFLKQRLSALLNNHT